MLTDPISMTGNGAAESFARLETDKRKTVYGILARGPSAECTLTINHQQVDSGIKTRNRSVKRLDEMVLLTDGATIGKNSVQIVIDRPVNQASDTAVLELLAKLVNYLDVPANAQAFLDGQS